jgi:hypothetical protein
LQQSITLFQIYFKFIAHKFLFQSHYNCNITMSYHKEAIESLREEIIADLNVNYIIDELIDTQILIISDRNEIISSGNEVGDINNPRFREKVIERQTEVFLKMILVKDDIEDVFDKLIVVLYKDDNFPWLAKQLQLKADELKRNNNNPDAVDEVFQPNSGDRLSTCNENLQNTVINFYFVRLK